jgi:hypothetical protein
LSAFDANAKTNQVMRMRQKLRDFLLVQRYLELVACILGVYFRTGLRQHKPGAEPRKLDQPSLAAQQEAEPSLVCSRRIVSPPEQEELVEMVEEAGVMVAPGFLRREGPVGAL